MLSQDGPDVLVQRFEVVVQGEVQVVDIDIFRDLYNLIHVIKILVRCIF